MVPWRYGRRGAVLIVAAVLLGAHPMVTAAQVVVPPPKPLPTAPTTTPPFTDPPTTAPPPTTTAPPPPAPTTSTPAPAPTTAAPVPTTTPSTPTSEPGSTTTTKAGGAVTTIGPSATTSTTTTAPERSGPPPPSISESAANAYLSGLARNPGPDSSTNALLAALRPLQDYGLSKDQAIAAGFGRFPVGGEAYFREDFGEPRDTPTPHGHQGNDIFTAFGTPVRSPANGVVTFTNEVVGGKCAYVTEADGTWYYMAHLRGFAPGIADGATVKIGDIVGFAGDTGDAQGGAPHVHFELHPGGGPAVSPNATLNGWLADAIAAAPNLVAQYTGGQELTGPLVAVGLARHLDLGVLAGMPRDVSPAPGLTAEQIADALVDPLTPPGLRR